MQTFHSDSLWTEIERLAKGSRYKMAAVAFTTNDSIVSLGAGDLLVVDATDAAIRTGQTDRLALKRAFRRGADLYSCPGLHAKVMLFDDVAVVGSANLSQASRSKLIEAGIITDEPTAVATARRFIEQLAEQSESIDKAFLDRIGRIEVRPPVRGIVSKRKPRLKLNEDEPQLWLAGLHRINYDDETQAQLSRWDEEATEAISDPEVEFESIQIGGHSRMRSDAKRGDLVIQIWREDRTAKQVDAVYRHVPIRLIRQNESHTWLFVEKRQDADETTKSWGDFRRHLRKIGFPRKVGPNSIQPVSPKLAADLLSLWDV
ncbi:MAG: phospholipase D-like domain-containing protein [Planctomycetales bacterium]